MWKRVVLLSMVASALSPARAADRRTVAIVGSSGVEAYTRVLEGIRSQLPDAYVFDARDEAGLRDGFANLKPALAIAVGADAATAIERSAALPVPVLKTFVFETELAVGAAARTAVTLDIPPAVLLTELKRYFPGKTRLGLIQGPAQTDEYVRTFEQAARQAGISLTVLRCLEARELVATFIEFKGKADFVWCPANTSLYTSVTLKPLLIASITNRLPIIGFSEPFVHAGALFGGGPDLTDAGQQTGLAAQRILKNEPVPSRVPVRKFRFVYNQRVARLLGVKAIGVENTSDVAVIR
jgi:ABC-type uncharacterized transport system substrate-binding protein